MDHLRALKTFIAVADSGSFTGAAGKLGMSGPSVTRVIGDLETDLGVLLLHRTTRAVSLTDPGRSFLLDARRILNDFEEARGAIRGAHREPKGCLHITAPVLFGQHYISPLLLEFLDQYHEVSVEATFLDRMVNIVEEGFDIAIRIGPLADSNMMATRVGAVRRVICGCPSYFEQHGIPQVPADLTDHRIIAARSVAMTNDWRFAGDTTIRVNPRFWVNLVPSHVFALSSQ